ncbi:hypothetical protein ONE63_011200 [Megalurothrips usitatus]|uniref:RNA-directed DNA polymerase n=1 Tax=Megalurothrips usitatus TaxID=439358 RepID=A0AAV7X599_9NEOP|nr:hypothetical protein ONE63_011200 [Megalurothrips usitatus]
MQTPKDLDQNIHAVSWYDIAPDAHERGKRAVVEVVGTVVGTCLSNPAYPVTVEVKPPRGPRRDMPELVPIEAEDPLSDDGETPPGSPDVEEVSAESRKPIMTTPSAGDRDDQGRRLLPGTAREPSSPVEEVLGGKPLEEYPKEFGVGWDLFRKGARDSGDHKEGLSRIKSPKRLQFLDPAPSSESDEEEAANTSRKFLSDSVLIQNLDTFKGGDDQQLEVFLTAVDQCGRMNGWSKDQKFYAARVKLRGEALRVAQTAKCNSWEQLCVALRGRYGSKELRAVTRRKVAQCIQRLDEEVSAYAERLKSLFSKIQPQAADVKVNPQLATVWDEMLCDRFIEGLKPSIRRPVMAKAPADYAAALAAANLEEQLDHLEGRTARVHPGLTAVVKIGDKIGKMMVDTGACISILDYDMVPVGTWVEKPPEGLVVKSATDHVMSFSGQGKVTLTFPEAATKVHCAHDFLISAEPICADYQGLLGNDWCIAYGAQLSPARHLVEINGVPIPLRPSTESSSLMTVDPGPSQALAMPVSVELRSLENNGVEIRRQDNDSGEAEVERNRGSVSTSPPLEAPGTSSPFSAKDPPTGESQYLRDETARADLPEAGEGKVRGCREPPSRAGVPGNHGADRVGSNNSVRETLPGDRDDERESQSPSDPGEEQLDAGVTEVKAGGAGGPSFAEVIDDDSVFSWDNDPLDREPLVQKGTTASAPRLAKKRSIANLRVQVPDYDLSHPAKPVFDTIIPPRSSVTVLLQAKGIGKTPGLRKFTPLKVLNDDVVFEAKDFIVDKGSSGIPVMIENNSNIRILVSKAEPLGELSPAELEDDQVPITYQDALPERDGKPFEESFKLQHLPVDLKQNLLNIFHSRKKAFLTAGGGLGKCNLVEHEIHLEPGTRPIACQPYRVPFQYQAELNSAIEEMLRDGVIERASGAWASPVVLVRRVQADGSIKVRFCTDFRRLNAKTIRDCFPMPNLFEQLAKLGGRCLYTSIDLKSAFWQLGVKREHRHLTGFVTPTHFFQYKRMPFGLKNSPPTFQRLMNRIFEDLDGEDVRYYMDDILIATIDDTRLHLKRIDQVLERLEKAGMTINPSKCSWLTRETQFLGHKLTHCGAQPLPSKVQAVLDFKEPVNAKQVRSFLGLVSWFRRNIPNLAERARCLVELTRKEAEFVWNEARQQAFDDLKQALANPPVLRFPDLDLDFLIFTDSSGYAIGALLAQKPEGVLHPISYHSRALTKCEQKWSATEREALAVIWAIRQNRYFLLGTKHFHVYTDHLPNQFLAGLKDSGNARLLRWSLLLSEYNFTIHYRPGRVQEAADCLSRMERKSIHYDVPVSRESREEDSTDRPPAQACQVNSINFQGYQAYWDRSAIRAEQREDESLKGLILSLEQQSGEGGNPEYALDFDGVLCKLRKSKERQDKIVVPQSMRDRVLSIMHESPLAGHAGVKRTYQRVRKEFFWKSMYVDVQRFCARCESCAQRKPDHRKRKAPLRRFPETLEKGETYGMDFVGPLSLTERGNRYLVTCIDIATRYLVAVPVAEISAQTAAEVFLEHVVCKFGAPKRLITDRGSQFLSEMWAELMRMLGIRHCVTTAYHPQGNSHVEKCHFTIIKSIAHFVNEAGSNWDEVLKFSLFAYNSAPHSALGWESPAYLHYGVDPRLPYTGLLQARRIEYSEDPQANIRTEIVKALKLAHEANRRAVEAGVKAYNKKTGPINITVGDRVYLSNKSKKTGECKKWRKLYLGPYRVQDRLDETTFLIREIYGVDEQAVHYNRLKLVKGYEDPISAYDRSKYVKRKLERDAEVESGSTDDEGPVRETRTHGMVTRSQVGEDIAEASLDADAFYGSSSEEEGSPRPPRRPQGLAAPEIIRPPVDSMPKSGELESAPEQLVTAGSRETDEVESADPLENKVAKEAVELGEVPKDTCLTKEGNHSVLPKTATSQADTVTDDWKSSGSDSEPERGRVSPYLSRVKNYSDNLDQLADEEEFEEAYANLLGSTESLAGSVSSTDEAETIREVQGSPGNLDHTVVQVEGERPADDEARQVCAQPDCSKPVAEPRTLRTRTFKPNYKM